MGGSKPTRSDLKRRLRHRLAPLLAAILWGPAGALAGPPRTDVPLVLGAGGWILEYFGREVAILRTALTRRDAPASGDGTGGVILSCSGRQRRLTVRLPGSVRPGARRTGTPDPGSLLIRTAPNGRASAPVIAPAQPSQAGTYSVSGEAGERREPVSDFARRLLDRESRFDLLLHDAPGPVTLASLTPLHVSSTLSADDEVAVRGFLAACTPASPRR